MTLDTVVDVAREALWLVLKTSAPMLVISLIVGLIISVFQTVTSIQEQTLTFVPKLVAIFIVLLLCGNWILKTMVDFMIALYSRFDVFVS